MQARKRHTLLWKGIRPLASAAAWLLFGFDTDICREKGPMIVLPTHNADLDPLFSVCAPQPAPRSDEIGRASCRERV